MLVYLPRSVKRASKLTAPPHEARWGGTTGVKVIGSAKGPYQLISTNGRILVRITGPYDDLHFPDLEGFTYDGETIINRAEWDKVFGLDKSAETIGIGAENKDLVLATYFGAIRCEPVDGRFPDYTMIRPNTPPMATFWLDPRLLRDLLDVFIDLFPNDEPERGIQFMYYGHAKAIGVFKKFANGMIAEAQIVPLVKQPKP